MYTLGKICEKRQLSAQLELSGRELLDDSKMAQVVCNGIGAAWMWDNLREVVSALNPALVLAADIHDLRYEEGGGYDDRLKADREFLENCLKLAAHYYGWYDPRRYRARKQARKFYGILRVFGAIAWKNGRGEWRAQ